MALSLQKKCLQNNIKIIAPKQTLGYGVDTNPEDTSREIVSRNDEP